ncbi:MAG: DUF4411 family protein, partial [Candidatus Obscuribacterales bacterium]|nr:DUF4411 family protein [Candidatus Obscuribacterales bacterium]
DPFVIALASVHRCAVITEEEPSAKPNKPRIPDVCKDLGIKTLKLVDVIKQEGWKF